MPRLLECPQERGSTFCFFCWFLRDTHLSQGPIVNDLGAMPTSNAAMPLDEFERLLDSASGLRVMTISPHLESRDNYSKIKALVSR